MDAETDEVTGRLSLDKVDMKNLVSLFWVL
jgi:hypothetical protein